MTAWYASQRPLLLAGELRATDLAAEAFGRARAHADCNAFLELFEEGAMRAAERVDARLRDGSAGSLAGMTVAVKDNIAMAGSRMTCASRLLANFVPAADATVIERLRAADAVIIGRTNMDEFAMGSSSEWSAAGPVRSCVDPARVAGGSSGGSAVAVAAGITHAALGSDTGGSVRQPAAFTGCTGFKPTYGRFSRCGLTAFASSFDSVGTFTRGVADAALLAEALSGHDASDATSLDEDPLRLAGAADAPLAGMRIGLVREFARVPAEEAPLRVLREAVARLRDAGAETTELSIPAGAYALPVYHIIANAEASSNLARYDGVRYGCRGAESGGDAAGDSGSAGGRESGGGSGSFDALVASTRSAGFGPEVKRRILLGTFILSAGYHERYYAKAQALRRVIRRDVEQAWMRVDALLSLTAPGTAFRIGERTGRVLEMYASDAFTVLANLAGLPAMSVPWGRDDAGLPIGLQVMAPCGGEAAAFRLAGALERLRDDTGDAVTA